VYNKTNRHSILTLVKLWKGETNLNFLRSCLDKWGHYKNIYFFYKKGTGLVSCYNPAILDIPGGLE
jgi:hypothetical protein